MKSSRGIYRTFIVAIFILTAILSITTLVSALSVYDFINRRIDEHYFIVVGAQGDPTDSFAAADIAIGLARHTPYKVRLPNAIHTEVSATANKVLIGHPCSNPLIEMSCEEWPYNKGEAIIKVHANNLIVAGTTAYDTRRAAKVVANYKDFPLLKDSSTVIVKGSSLELYNIFLEMPKNPGEFICGDKVCETGEKFLCYADCASTDCFTKCSKEGFANAFCRDEPTNPAIPACSENEEDFGLGYCATGKVCCCKIKEGKVEEADEDGVETAPQQAEQNERGILSSIINWLVNVMSRIFS